MERIIVNKVNIEDIHLLQEVGKLTFLETFADSNSEENMQKYLQEGFSLEKLKAELGNPESLFFFAIDRDQVIGYLKLNSGKSQTEVQEFNAIEIERIYVLKAYHGQKIGQLLYQKALEIAKEKAAPYIWLGVWEHNEKALKFYTKNGFVEFGKHSFWLGNDEQIDLMMKLELT